MDSPNRVSCRSPSQTTGFHKVNSVGRQWSSAPCNSRPRPGGGCAVPLPPCWPSSATKGIEMAGTQWLAKTDRRCKCRGGTGNEKKDETQEERVNVRYSLPRRLTKKTRARNKNKKADKGSVRHSLCLHIYKEEPQRLPRIENRLGRQGCVERRELKLSGRMEDPGCGSADSPPTKRPHKQPPRAWRAGHSLNAYTYSVHGGLLFWTCMTC